MDQMIASSVVAANSSVQSNLIDRTGEAVNQFSSEILGYAIILAAIGTITMALIELYKSMMNSRLHFHKKRVRAWLNADRDPDAYSEMMSIATGNPIKDDFLTSHSVRITNKAMGEVHFSDVIFDQPTEKMMGQFQSAANIVMDFPARYPALYAFLTGSVSANRLHEDARQWVDYCAMASNGMAYEGYGEKKLGREASQSRARLANLVARKLDGFQNETQYLWAEYNQRAAVVLGSIIMYSVLKNSDAGDHLGPLAIALLSVIGGMVSPFAKDVVSALSGLNAKRK